MHVTTKALVLRGVDYKESDKILTLLTSDMGKLTASARGCRKKGSSIAAGCQLLCWSELVLYEYQGRWAVKEANTERQFRGVREDLEKLNKPQSLIKAAFELKAMCLAGYEPLLDGCAVCGAETPADPRFHLREGVLHCASCRGEMGDGISMPLDDAGLKAMQHIAWGDPKRLFSIALGEESLKRFSDLTEAYLHTQLERGFHTLDFYKSIKL